MSRGTVTGAKKFNVELGFEKEMGLNIKGVMEIPCIIRAVSKSSDLWF